MGTILLFFTELLIGRSMTKVLCLNWDVPSQSSLRSVGNQVIGVPWRLSGDWHAQLCLMVGLLVAYIDLLKTITAFTPSVNGMAGFGPHLLEYLPFPFTQSGGRCLLTWGGSLTKYIVTQLNLLRFTHRESES